MTQYLTQELNLPAYYEKVKLPRFNCAVSALTAPLPSDAARVMRRVSPSWDRADHERLAAQHFREFVRLTELHRQLLDDAHWETFGTARQAQDYQITAIGRAEYPPSFKDELRKAAYGAGQHSRLHAAHLAAAPRASAQ